MSIIITTWIASLKYIWIINENEYSLIASISTTTHYYVDNAILDIYDNNYHETIKRIIDLAISYHYDWQWDIDSVEYNTKGNISVRDERSSLM